MADGVVALSARRRDETLRGRGTNGEPAECTQRKNSLSSLKTKLHETLNRAVEGVCTIYYAESRCTIQQRAMMVTQRQLYRRWRFV
jgi:hypothetical protein